MKSVVFFLLLVNFVGLSALAQTGQPETGDAPVAKAQAPAAPLQSLRQIYGKEQLPMYYFTEARRSILANDYENGALFLAAGMMCGAYDTFRVKDKTAHQAVMVAWMGISNGLDLAPLKNTSLLKNKPESMRGICDEARQLGPPSYYPSYMIDHGLEAVEQALEQQAGRTPEPVGALVEPFDSAQGWEQALAKCGCP